MREEFKSERELCAAFCASAGKVGFRAYPEHAGWDVYLARRGIQVGVQAKLTAVPEVLTQALPKFNWRGRCAQVSRGPTYRAVLVSRFPGRTPAARERNRQTFYRLANATGLLVLDAGVQTWLRKQFLTGRYAGTSRRGLRIVSWEIDWRYYRCPVTAGLELPPFVPDLPAGVPAPVTLSPWKLATFDVEILFDEREFVTLDDAREVTVRRGASWNPKTLLARTCTCTSSIVAPGSRQRKWVLRENRRPSRAYPDLFAQYLYHIADKEE